MRRFHTLMTMVAIAMLSFSVMSCETDDDDIAYSLQGTWRGTITSGYDRYGGSSYYTQAQIEFYQDPYSYARGSGREVDYDSWGVTDIVDFYYEVRNRVIYMDYSDGSHIAIYNWNLYDYGDTFVGEFHDYYSGEYLASFRFYREYSWDYGWSKIQKEVKPRTVVLTK